MKYIGSFLLFIITFFTLANDTTNLSGLKKGSNLYYELDAYGEKSSLKITILSLNDTVSFSYLYSNKTAGTITILPDAIKNASSLKCVFDNKDNLSTLQPFTALFLSKKMYNLAFNNNIQSIDVGLNEPKKIRLQNKFEYKTELDIHNLFKSKVPLLGDGYTINGFANKLSEIRFLTEQNLLDMAAINDPKFPLITYIDMGWKLTLKSITNF
jgi:hypothetical protein